MFKCLLGLLFVLGTVAQNSFVYLVTNPNGANAVQAWSRNQQTGLLTQIGRFPTGGTGDADVGGFQQDPLLVDGEFLYVVNPGSDTITSFRVTTSGALQQLSQVPSGGRRPVALAISGTLMYVANQGNRPGNPANILLPGSYSGFRISNGVITPIPGSTVMLPPGGSPNHVVFSPNGEILVGCRGFGNRVDSFRVTPQGMLVDQRETFGAGGPFAAVFNPVPGQNQVAVVLHDDFVPDQFTNQRAPGIDIYDFRPNGVLGFLDRVQDEAFADPCWVLWSQDGSTIWIGNFAPRTVTALTYDSFNDRIVEASTFQPNDFTIALNQTSGLLVQAITGATDIRIDAAENFFYQLRAYSLSAGVPSVPPRLEVFRLTGNPNFNAGLQPIQALDLPADLENTGVMGLVIIDF